jgi:hypothetical protein
MDRAHNNRCELVKESALSSGKVLNLDTRPILYHVDLIIEIYDVLIDRNMPKSEFCRSLFLDSRFAFFAEFSQTQIAELLGIVPLLGSRCKSQAEEDKTAKARCAGDVSFVTGQFYEK